MKRQQIVVFVGFLFLTLNSFNLVKADSNASIKQFDDWFYRCAHVALDKDKAIKQCEITQLQQVKNDDETLNILSMAIAQSKPDKKGGKPSLLLTSIVPLNVYLPDGIKFRVSNKDIVKIIFRNCNQSGCWAQQKLSPQMITSLQKKQ